MHSVLVELAISTMASTSLLHVWGHESVMHGVKCPMAVRCMLLCSEQLVQVACVAESAIMMGLCTNVST